MISQFPLSIARTFRVSALATTGLLSLISQRSSAAEAAPAPASATPLDAGKTHTLYMGVDLSVAQNKQFYPVRDVSGGSFVINVKGQPVFVEMNAMFKAPVNLRIDQKLKLSRASASLAKLVGERAYAPGHDPRQILALQQMDLNVALADKRVESEIVVADLQSGTGSLGIKTAGPLDARNPSSWSPNPNPTGASGRDANSTGMMAGHAREALRSAEQRLSTVGSSGEFAERLDKELAKELFDAMSVRFEVTADHPLNNPFVVVLTRFHAQNAKPGEVQNWIYAKSLDPISTEPQKVHVLQGGFPPGFVLEDYQVHLYNHGQEVASNVAPKRVPLTTDEAMMYLMIEYVAEHKNQTLPASLAMAALPEDFRTSLAKQEAKPPLFVKVATDGRVAGAFLDESCTQPFVDPLFASIVKDIRFKPALEKGKPIESVTPLKLTDLFSAL